MSAIELGVATARDAVSGLVAGRLLDDDAAIEEAYAAAVWSWIAEPGDAVAGALIDALGAREALALALSGPGSMRSRHRDDPSGARLRQALARWQPRVDDMPAAVMFDGARRRGIRLLTSIDEEWPIALGDLGPHRPHCLWVRGDAGALARGGAPSAGSSVAIVGARAATGYGEHVAMELSAELAATDVTIVSGAAYGIDGAAHRAALSAGGRTIALLAGGVDRPYPSGHARLIDAIDATGAVASEVPCGSAPTKWRFLQRNRLIAALADATVVVEAGWRSGSLNTAGHASALGRPLGAVPGPVTSAASAGCHRLLREFDARCITSAADVRELLGIAGAATEGAAEGDGGRHDVARPSGRSDGPEGERTRVLDALSVRAPRGVDDLARRTGMAREAIQSTLALLELDARATRGADGWRRVARRPDA